MNILLCVDGSACSDRAVESLITHVGWFREPPQIHLLHVHPPIPVGGVQQHVGHDTVQAYYREEGEAQLAGARRRLDQAGLAYVVHLHVGLPAAVITHQAEQLACDLICLGAHGRSALSSALLGSVTASVLQLSGRSLLVAR
jgi:nucleotide-binding universal stress UspA family protein